MPGDTFASSAASNFPVSASDPTARRDMASGKTGTIGKGSAEDNNFRYGTLVVGMQTAAGAAKSNQSPHGYASFAGLRFGPEDDKWSVKKAHVFFGGSQGITSFQFPASDQTHISIQCGGMQSLHFIPAADEILCPGDQVTWMPPSVNDPEYNDQMLRVRQAVTSAKLGAGFIPPLMKKVTPELHLDLVKSAAHKMVDIWMKDKDLAHFSANIRALNGKHDPLLSLIYRMFYLPFASIQSLLAGGQVITNADSLEGIRMGVVHHFGIFQSHKNGEDFILSLARGLPIAATLTAVLQNQGRRVRLINDTNASVLALVNAQKLVDPVMTVYDLARPGDRVRAVYKS